MFNNNLIKKAKFIVDDLKKAKRTLSTAESCTGGLLSALITEIPGSSEVFLSGYVTYCNKSKIETLTVPTYFIEDFGAVSSETAIAMAEGSLLIAHSDFAISITGIAGPDGGTLEKPVGLVFIALAVKNAKTSVYKFQFSGDRSSVRLQTVDTALELLKDRLT